MQSKLADLIDNLSEINKNECKSCMERKNIKSECDFMEFRNNRLYYKCKECRKKCSKLINEAIRHFPNMYRFCNGDRNRFVLLLKKGFYPYEYMDSWERFNEISKSNKKAFYSKLNLEDITDEDHAYVKKVWEVFEIKNQSDYHDCMFSVIHYSLQLDLTTLEISVLKYMDLILLFVCQHQD